MQLKKVKQRDTKKKLAEGKKIILKRQKLLRITDKEEGGWEFVKCHLSDDLPSDSEDEKQLSRACREAAANKKRKQISKISPPPIKNSEIFSKPHQGYSGIRNNSNPKKVCFACVQGGHFQYFCPNRRNRKNN